MLSQWWHADWKALTVYKWSDDCFTWNKKWQESRSNSSCNNSFEIYSPLTGCKSEARLCWKAMPDKDGHTAVGCLCVSLWFVSVFTDLKKKLNNLLRNNFTIFFKYADIVHSEQVLSYHAHKQCITDWHSHSHDCVGVLCSILMGYNNIHPIKNYFDEQSQNYFVYQTAVSQGFEHGSLCEPVSSGRTINCSFKPPGFPCGGIYKMMIGHNNRHPIV